MSSPRRILVVDDDLVIREFVVKTLAKEGYDCHAAQGGEAALDFLSMNGADLAIIDVRMPGMTGLELQKKAVEMYPDLAVIMMTGVSERSTVKTALNQGAFGYLLKPCEPPEVVISVANALRLRDLEIANRNYRQELERQVTARTAELQQAYQELKHVHEQALSQEKMASLGQLAAGVAHEINTPVGYIASNLKSLKNYFTRLNEYMAALAGWIRSANSGTMPADLATLEKKLKIGQITGDGAELIAESIEGTAQISSLVKSLKNFSRADESLPETAEINQLLEASIKIAWNELKYKAEIVREFGELPAIYCQPRQLIQVFINLLVNAAQAIDKKGEVRVGTKHREDHVVITIADTGCGIADEQLALIFEPFYTTKKSGAGTGLGLSIVYDIIKSHGGDICVSKRDGGGTVFTVRLPAGRTAITG